MLPLATSLDDLKSRITAAVNSSDKDTLRCVWDEFNYSFDAVLAAVGENIEHLKNGSQFALHNLSHHLLSFAIVTTFSKTIQSKTALNKNG